jgi:hypothetical protein
MYGVTVVGRSLILPKRCDSKGSVVVAICAKVAQAERLQAVSLALGCDGDAEFTYRLIIENAVPAL